MASEEIVRYAGPGGGPPWPRHLPQEAFLPMPFGTEGQRPTFADVNTNLMHSHGGMAGPGMQHFRGNPVNNYGGAGYSQEAEIRIGLLQSECARHRNYNLLLQKRVVQLELAKTDQYQQIVKLQRMVKVLETNLLEARVNVIEPSSAPSPVSPAPRELMVPRPRPGLLNGSSASSHTDSKGCEDSAQGESFKGSVNPLPRGLAVHPVPNPPPDTPALRYCRGLQQGRRTELRAAPGPGFPNQDKDAHDAATCAEGSGFSAQTEDQGSASCSMLSRDRSVERGRASEGAMRREHLPGEEKSAESAAAERTVAPAGVRSSAHAPLECVSPRQEEGTDACGSGAPPHMAPGQNVDLSATGRDVQAGGPVEGEMFPVDRQTPSVQSFIRKMLPTGRGKTPEEREQRRGILTPALLAAVDRVPGSVQSDYHPSLEGPTTTATAATNSYPRGMGETSNVTPSGDEADAPPSTRASTSRIASTIITGQDGQQDKGAGGVRSIQRRDEAPHARADAGAQRGTRRSSRQPRVPSPSNETVVGEGAPVGEPSTEPLPISRVQEAAPKLVARPAGEEVFDAEGRSTHVMVCSRCEGPPPEGKTMGLCEGCPRRFCADCLLKDATDAGLELTTDVTPDSRALLVGRAGDFFVKDCLWCLRKRDLKFSAPPEGVAPMKHLLEQLLRHDLSRCFREPVDLEEHPDYLEAIGRGSMMDLGTMMSKLESRKYPRRRGPGQFLDDLSKIWRNCRRFAGCDELGRPHYGTLVPGIVRCALVLEAMSKKFYDTYMADQQGTAWPESAWGFYRQKAELANEEARLKQLERRESGEVDRGTAGADGEASEAPRTSSSVTRGATTSAEHLDGRGTGNAGIAATGEAEAEASSSSASSTQRASGVSDGKPFLRSRKRDSCKISRSEKEEAAGGGEEGGTSSSRELRSRRKLRTGPKAGNNVLPDAVGRSSDKQELPQWDMLDKLCDVAASFIT